MYAYHDKVEECRDYYKKCLETEPDFKLDDVKVLRLVGALVKSNSLNEAFELLEKHQHQVSTTIILVNDIFSPNCVIHCRLMMHYHHLHFRTATCVGAFLII